MRLPENFGQNAAIIAVLGLGVLTAAALIALLILFPPAATMLPPIYFCGGIVMDAILFGLVYLGIKQITDRLPVPRSHYRAQHGDYSFFNLVGSSLVAGPAGLGMIFLVLFQPQIAFIIAAVGVGIALGALASTLIGGLALCINFCFKNENKKPQPLTVTGSTTCAFKNLEVSAATQKEDVFNSNANSYLKTIDHTQYYNANSQVHAPVGEPPTDRNLKNHTIG